VRISKGEKKKGDCDSSEEREGGEEAYHWASGGRALYRGKKEKNHKELKERKSGEEQRKANAEFNVKMSC